MAEEVKNIKFPRYVFEIGVITENKAKRKKDKKNIDDDKPMNNAEILYLNENGSPLHHIPSRPVLKMTYEWAIQTDLIVKYTMRAIGIYIITQNVDDYDREMQKAAIEMQNYARDIIYSNDGRLKANAPSTIAAKGDNHPLFDTGQLARSITCRAVRVE